MGVEQKIFHFPHGDGIVDVDAFSYSEARRSFFKATGEWPDENKTIVVTDKKDESE